MTTAGKESKGWLKKSLLRVSSTETAVWVIARKEKSADQGIGHQEANLVCWPFARAYVTLLQ
jgi:hypothetical protein